MRSILATDCGSTTTKAILIEKIDGEYRLKVRGEAPTTVEAPFEDVTKGVLNAVMEVEELSGKKILNGDQIITPQNGSDGVDIYISTSSAGGGLQMGKIVGQTDAHGGEATSDLYGPEHLNATIMHLLGVDHKKLIYCLEYSY